jgi:hypothetical protein
MKFAARDIRELFKDATVCWMNSMYLLMVRAERPSADILSITGLTTRLCTLPRTAAQTTDAHTIEEKQDTVRH